MPWAKSSASPVWSSARALPWRCRAMLSGRSWRRSAPRAWTGLPAKKSGSGAGGRPREERAVIRVLIVAAYASVRAGLHALLADAEDLAMAGAVSGSEELERIL